LNLAPAVACLPRFLPAGGLPAWVGTVADLACPLLPAQQPRLRLPLPPSAPLLPFPAARAFTCVAAPRVPPHCPRFAAVCVTGAAAARLVSADYRCRALVRCCVFCRSAGLRCVVSSFCRACYILRFLPAAASCRFTLAADLPAVSRLPATAAAPACLPQDAWTSGHNSGLPPACRIARFWMLPCLVCRAVLPPRARAADPRGYLPCRCLPAFADAARLNLWFAF